MKLILNTLAFGILLLVIFDPHRIDTMPADTVRYLVALCLGIIFKLEADIRELREKIGKGDME